MSTPCRCGAVQIGQGNIWTADGIFHTPTECAWHYRIITASWAWAPLPDGEGE